MDRETEYDDWRYLEFFTVTIKCHVHNESYIKHCSLQRGLRNSIILMLCMFIP